MSAFSRFNADKDSRTCFLRISGWRPPAPAPPVTESMPPAQGFALMPSRNGEEGCWKMGVFFDTVGMFLLFCNTQVLGYYRRLL